MKEYYVYLLTDPRNNNEVFYCGKGTRNRWKSHIGHWAHNGKNNPTENKIKKIQEAGFQPNVIFLHTGIFDENLAYELEEQYIQENFDKLTNTKVKAIPPSKKGIPSKNKGKKLTQEQKEKISRGLMGKKRGPLSESWKEAISKSLSKEKHPHWKKPSKRRKSIIEIKTNTIYSDQITASQALNIRQSDIANCLSGRQKSVKGFKFKYYDN